MASSAPAPTHRASLLAGLRTGGVRSASMTGLPHTAAPGASFNIPSRYTSAAYNQQAICEEDDQLSDMLSHNMYINAQQQRVYQTPNTAAVDGGANRFSQQQQGHFTNSMIPGIPHPNTAIGNAQLQAHAQQQALQVQLMQLELIRMQVRSPSPRSLLLQLIFPPGPTSSATAGRTSRSESPTKWSIFRLPCIRWSHCTVIRSSSGHSQRPVTSAQPRRVTPIPTWRPE